MTARRSGARVRVYQALTGAVRFVYERPVLLALLPFAVFFPLLDSRGLYEFGDANFPLNPFWIDYMLPWSGAASAGADNTFIGVPRLVYHLGINILISVFHNLQVAQWIWYSSMTVLGLMGAYCLARRLGAGLYSVPLAIFYALNLWSYDRIAQEPDLHLVSGAPASRLSVLEVSAPSAAWTLPSTSRVRCSSSSPRCRLVTWPRSSAWPSR